MDYAYRAKHLVTVAAKRLIEAHYGRAATYAYFNSCSNGGRHGLMEVQRYPDDYDGVVVGAPWNYQSHSRDVSGMHRRSARQGQRYPCPSCPPSSPRRSLRVMRPMVSSMP